MKIIQNSLIKSLKSLKSSINHNNTSSSSFNFSILTKINRTHKSYKTNSFYNFQYKTNTSLTNTSASTIYTKTTSSKSIEDYDINTKRIFKIQEYLDVLIDKNNGDKLDLKSFTKFLTLYHQSSDYLDFPRSMNETIYSKLSSIIEKNKNIYDNHVLTKYCYEKLNLEKNHIIFNFLLNNKANLIKKAGTKDSLENFPYFAYSLKTINNVVLENTYNENLCLKLLQEYTKFLDSNTSNTSNTTKNSNGQKMNPFDTKKLFSNKFNDVLSFITIFKELKVQIEESMLFKMTYLVSFETNFFNAV